MWSPVDDGPMKIEDLQSRSRLSKSKQEYGRSMVAARGAGGSESARGGDEERERRSAEAQSSGRTGYGGKPAVAPVAAVKGERVMRDLSGKDRGLIRIDIEEIDSGSESCSIESGEFESTWGTPAHERTSSAQREAEEEEKDEMFDGREMSIQNSLISKLVARIDKLESSLVEVKAEVQKLREEQEIARKMSERVDYIDADLNRVGAAAQGAIELATRATNLVCKAVIAAKQGATSATTATTSKTRQSEQKQRSSTEAQMQQMAAQLKTERQMHDRTKLHLNLVSQVLLETRKQQ